MGRDPLAERAFLLQSGVGGDGWTATVFEPLHGWALDEAIREIARDGSDDERGDQGEREDVWHAAAVVRKEHT
jgi:hypothetical protein